MNRRKFLGGSGLVLLAGARAPAGAQSAIPSSAARPTVLFLAGDVMTGRGIDQVLATPSDPRLYESYMQRATGYVRLAESASGPLPKPVEFAYPWGDALEELEKRKPDWRIINLETAVTTSGDFWPDKGIHYRMHPANIPVFTTAGIDCCVIANNHVLDWGRSGFVQTLGTLERAGLRPAGGGMHLAAARAPSVLDGRRRGRLLVFAYASPSSGVPADWAATKHRAGVSFLPRLSAEAADRIGEDVGSWKEPGDVVLVSIHWGGNWGYDVPDEQREFAHRLIDDADVDVVHGHSSHHPKAIEIYRDQPILYGCGDFLNDYEGIGGHESCRPGLVLMYLATLKSGSGALAELVMVPFEIRRMRLRHASTADTRWLAERMDRECAKFGGGVSLTQAGDLRLEWPIDSADGGS